MERSDGEKNGMHQDVLNQFKKNLSDVLTAVDTDAILMKWLRAKNYSLEKAELLFRQNLACRATCEVEKFVDNTPYNEVFEKHRFVGYLGTAKDGTVVRYIALGRSDCCGYIMAMTSYEMIRFCVLILEIDIRKQRELSKQTGKEINEITYIVDLEGFAIQQCAHTSVVETGLDFFRVYQDYYPESWRHLLVVNAPAYFYAIFSVFRPMMRRTFLQNMKVVSRESTPELLLRYVDADVLPAFLGGKRVDSKGDPMCTEFIKFGGKIPEKYYLRNKTPLMPTDPGVEVIWIGPKCYYNYAMVIREAGSRIHLEMRSEGGSVGSDLLYRKFGPDPEKLDIPASDEYLNEQDPKGDFMLCIPHLRLQTHLTPIDDSCCAVWPGIYIFRFDNTHSWFTSRKIIYRIRVTPPES